MGRSIRYIVARSMCVGIAEKFVSTSDLRPMGVIMIAEMQNIHLIIVLGE